MPSLWPLMGRTHQLRITDHNMNSKPQFLSLLLNGITRPVCVAFVVYLMCVFRCVCLANVYLFSLDVWPGSCDTMIL